jgi:hypothetical protein
MRRSAIAAHFKMTERALEQLYVNAAAEEEQKEDASAVRHTCSTI